MEDLSWEDKERVIRALFVFINRTYRAPTRSSSNDDAESDGEREYGDVGS